MQAKQARDNADKSNSYSKDEDYLDDRVLDGILIDVLIESRKGEYSLIYDKTGGLTNKDLRYCKEELEKLDYLVSMDYESRVIILNW
jgi:hypothetical protein